MNKTYRYHLFLLHPVTKCSMVMTIEIDSEEGKEFVDAHSLLSRIYDYPDFPEGYTLISLQVGEVTLRDLSTSYGITS